VNRIRALRGAAGRNWRRFRAADSPWEWVADVVVHHPGKVLGVCMGVLSIPLLALPMLELDHDTLAQIPSDAESAQGFRALRDHIEPGELEPIVVIIESEEAEIWEPSAFHALGVMSENLKRLDGIASVRSVAMPTDGETPAEVEEGFEEEFDELATGLEEAAEGASEIEGGVVQLRDGLAEAERGVPELVAGLDEAAAGADQLSAGAAEARDGVRALRAGVAEARDGVAQLRAGADELRAGVAEARDGAAQLRDEIAGPAESSIRRGYEALVGMTIGRTDPLYERARREFGEAYALITGEYPAGHPQAGQQVDPEYDGLEVALDELASGLGEATGGLEQLSNGLAELEEGLAQIDSGLAELEAGLEQLAAGAGELSGGVAEAAAGARELDAGLTEMREGIDAELLPGVRELAAGLEEGAQEVEDAPLELLMPGAGPGPFIITPGLLEAEPEIREDLDFFVADSGTRTRLFLGTEAASYTDEAMDTVREAVTVIEMSLNGSPLEDALVLPTGPTAFLAELDEVASDDFRLIVVAVVLGIFIVLALLLRSLIAPLYMTASVVFSFLVALGLATLVFQGVLGHDGLAWYLPPFLFVLLVALGIDYSIFLMSRVREEADRRPTVPAVAFGLRSTGHVITSAGLILAGTFGALMTAPMPPLAQLGFAVSAGVLIDTFIVRSFIVPAVAVLLGRWNWWPSERAALHHEEAATAHTAPMTAEHPDLREDQEPAPVAGGAGPPPGTSGGDRP
jgi:putative drug exporter of the RND superfamily